MSERTQRFLPDEPKREIALRQSHDFEDKTEVPKFINLPSDQGLLAPADEAADLIENLEEPLGEPVAAKVDIVPNQKKSSTSALPVELGVNQWVN